MSQHDYVIANGTGAAVRSDLNGALAAIVSNNSGATAPSTTYAYMWWADTTTGLLKLRNAANNAWITLFQLDGEWSTLAVENGSASAPSIYFKDSGTDTGIYSPGADQVAISTNGSGRLFVDSSGRVGVGTSSPQSRLDLGPQQSNTTPSRTATKYQLVMSTGDTTSEYSHNIGFYLAGNNNVTAAIDTVENGGDGATGLVFATSSSTAVDPSERLRITADGKVGIGTQSPGSALEINAAAATSPFIAKINTAEAARIDSSGRLLVGTSSSYANYGTPLLQLDNSSGAEISLRRSVTSDLTNVGFITAYSTHGLCTVIHSITDGTQTASSTPGAIRFSTQASGSTGSPTERMRISQNGETVFYGNGSVTAARSNTGAGTGVELFNGYHSATGVTNGTRVIAIYTNGNIQNTNGSYTTLSDAKLKENIVDANSQWDDLKSIQIRNWNFKAETGHETHRQIGPIAQELEQVCPSLVFETPDRDKDGNETGEVTKGVNQSVLYMKAVKALQEAMERIEQLEAEMAEVKGQLL